MSRKSKHDPDFSQLSFLSEEAGSPLFSGSPMKANDAPFTPEPKTRQSGLFGPATFGDLAGVRESEVHCPFCDSLVRPHSGRLPLHVIDGSALFGGVFHDGDPCEGSGLSVS